MRCPNCHETDHASNAIFCHMCGSRLEKRKPKWLLRFGFILTFLVGLYFLLAFSSYLTVSNVNASDIGGEVTVQIYTDALFVDIESKDYWLCCKQNGKTLCLTIPENNNTNDREAEIKVYAGLLKCREATIHVKQKGKAASYLHVSKQMVSFSDQGGAESLQIRTDGREWHVVDWPDWVTISISENTLVLTASKNKLPSSRSGTARIKADANYIDITILQKPEALENFTEFWELFCSDPMFQKSRIGFPLPYTYYEEEWENNDDIEVNDYLYSEEWHYDKMYDIETQIKIEQKDDSYIVTRSGRENGICIIYIFNH